MWQTKLCLGIDWNSDISVPDQLKLLKQTGFEAFFIGWSPELDMKAVRACADELGLIWQSVHAPFGNVHKMWEEGPEGEAMLAELIRCLEDCAACNVPIMVSHCFIGFGKEDANPIGVRTFAPLVRRAEELGVKIAFENTEGETYLAMLMDAFKDSPNVGFCWDTGHEMCYNHSKDMLALYGDRLIATHLNDNLGIKDYGGKIIWTDDLHLLPFDGIGDWQDITDRMNDHGYDDILTFELNLRSKPDRYENAVYTRMPFEEYLAEVYKRACRVAVLKQRSLKNRRK